MQISEHIYRSKTKTVSGWCEHCEGTLYVGERHTCGSINARTARALMKHAPNWNADDRTLCGVALDAQASGDVSERVEIATDRETVDCLDCCSVIKHCQQYFQSNAIAGLFRLRKPRARR